MLTELERKQYAFEFGETVIAMRYTLADLLALEKLGISYLDVFADRLTADKILAFFAAGIVEELPEDMPAKIAESVGFEEIWEHCRAAMLISLPQRDPKIVPRARKNEGEFSFVRMRTLICDVMGKPEEFFWDSTLAELLSRWQEYAVAMGYAEEPERIMEYDEEGM